MDQIKNKKDKIVQQSIVGIFIILYLFTSIISTIHCVDFFEMTNSRWLAVALAVAFEFGAAASLAAIVVGEKTNKTIVWGLFFILTAFQMQGNMWYAYVNARDYMSWIELFQLTDFTLIEQKSILALVSGTVLPIVALGFIKSLVDYIKPDESAESEVVDNKLKSSDNFTHNTHKLEEKIETENTESETTEPETIESETIESETIESETEDSETEDSETIEDIKTFGENLKREDSSLDAELQQKRRPTAQ